MGDTRRSPGGNQEGMTTWITKTARGSPGPERRQETRDRKWRRNIKAEVPSWSSIVKPLQPKFLRTDQYKSLRADEYKSKYRSKLILTHGGEEGSVKNFENFENSKSTERPGGSTKTHMNL